MSKWSEFYKSRDLYGYYKHYFKKRYKPFLDAIASEVNISDTTVELGCGCANTTRALMEMHKGCFYTCVDNDTDMLKLAIEQIGIREDTYFIKADATHPSPYRGVTDVIHSHGLLEHMPNTDIFKITNVLYRGSKQIHYVPGLYPEPSFGDERLMSVESWQEICSPDEIITFNDGLDYCLIFKGEK